MCEILHVLRNRSEAGVFWFLIGAGFRCTIARIAGTLSKYTALFGLYWVVPRGGVQLRALERSPVILVQRSTLGGQGSLNATLPKRIQ